MPWVSPAVDHFRPAREYLKDVLGEEDAIGVKYIVGWQANDDVQGSRVHQTAADEFSPVEAWKTDMSIYELFMCSGCKRLASPSEIDEEVVSYYCTNCLEVLPQSAVTAHKGRCPKCFQCPDCQRILDVVCLSAEDRSGSSEEVYELACTSDCDYHSSVAGLIAASTDALLSKARSLEEACADAEWMRDVLPVYRERCLKTSEYASPRSRPSKAAGWRAVRHLRDSSSPWSLTDLDAKLEVSSPIEAEFARDGLPLSRNEDERVRILFPPGSTIADLRQAKHDGPLQTISSPSRCRLASRRSFRHASKCKKLLLKSQILPDHSQPYSMRAYASDFIPLCMLRDGRGGTRPTMPVGEDSLEFYLTLRNPRSEPIEVKFDTKLNDDFLEKLVPPCHSNWPGEVAQHEARHAEVLPNMRFVTEPFVIVVGGSDIDISESEMVTRDSPPELVQSQRHRAAVKLTVQKAQRPSALSADSIKSPLREGLSRVTLKPHSPDIKFWQVLLRLHISATSPDPGDRGVELLLRIRVGEIDHAQIS